MLAIVLAIAVGAPSDVKIRCKRDDRGYCTDRNLTVELGEGVTDVYLKVNTALGDVFSIRFPQGVRIPKGGVELGNPAVFAAERKDGKILVRPKVPENAQVGARELLNERTNLQIETERGWRISLDLRQWYPTKSMQSLVFRSPAVDRQERYIAERVAKARAELEEGLREAQERVELTAEERSVEKMARDVLLRNSCDESTETDMHDLLWVKKERICAIGRRVYLVFRIRNRARNDEFRLGDVEILTGEGEQRLDTRLVLANEDRQALQFEDVRLRMNDEVVGTIAWSAVRCPGPESAAKECTLEETGELVLRVTEAGGKQRVVDVEDVGF